MFLCNPKVHGRSREQRYTKVADWEYIKTCAAAAHPVPLFGNGDMLSFEDYNCQLSTSGVDGIMIARYILIIIIILYIYIYSWKVSPGENFCLFHPLLSWVKFLFHKYFYHMLMITIEP